MHCLSTHTGKHVGRVRQVSLTNQGDVTQPVESARAVLPYSACSGPSNTKYRGNVCTEMLAVIDVTSVKIFLGTDDTL